MADDSVDRLPTPLARAYLRARSAAKDLRAEQALTTSEYVIRWLATTAMARCIASGLSAEASFTLLRDRPTFGHWWRVLRELDFHLAELGEPVLGESFRRTTRDVPALLALRRRVVGGHKESTSPFDGVESLIQVRNGKAHSRISAEDFAALGPVLLKSLAEIVRAVRAFDDWDVVSAPVVSKHRDHLALDLRIHRSDRLEVKEDTAPPSSAWYQGGLFLRHRETGDLIDLFPFAKIEADEIIVFCGLDRGVPTYLPAATDRAGDLEAGLRQILPFMFRPESTQDVVATSRPPTAAICLLHEAPTLVDRRDPAAVLPSAVLSCEAGALATWIRLPSAGEGLRGAGRVNRYVFAHATSLDAPWHDAMALQYQGSPSAGGGWRIWLGSGTSHWSCPDDPNRWPAGWHHFLLSWDRARDRIGLAIDGREVVSASGMRLRWPTRLADGIHVSRWIDGGDRNGAGAPFWRTQALSFAPDAAWIEAELARPLP